MSKLLKNYFVLYFPIALIFSFNLFAPSDSDLGWHLKYGEYFFQNGHVLRENIYTTMMEGYKWINSSWGTDLVSYLAFGWFGFSGLSILGAIIITLTIMFFVWSTKVSFWELALFIPLILYLEQPLFVVSFRGQLLSLLGISIMYFLFSQFYAGSKKALLMMIPLFIIWSNLHGQFLLGLGLFFLLALGYLIQRRLSKEMIFVLAIFSIAIVVTLINPFGLGIYQESIRHFGNPLQRYIIEWLPFERFSLLWWNLILWEVLVLVSLAILIYRKQFLVNLHFIIPVIVLLILSFYVRRYSWVLYLISIPVVKHLFDFIKPKEEDISSTISVLILVMIYLYIIFVKAPKENIFNMNWDRYCEYIGCSSNAGNFLSEHKYEGKMMTFYNWGGWLIWNYPQVKPSIDGRMHLWRDDQGYSAFMDYYPYEQNWKDINESEYDVVLISGTKPVYKRLTELVSENKWKIDYADKKATVFVRLD